MGGLEPRYSCATAARLPATGLMDSVIKKKGEGVMDEQGNSASERTTFIPRADSEESEINLESAFAEWGRYQVLDCLGTGATSRVYRAVDPSLNRKVALKFILGGDPSTEKRF